MIENQSAPTTEEPDRRCTQCAQVKPASSFHRCGRGRRRGVCSACRPATRARVGEEAPEQRRGRHLRGDYKISSAQYGQLYEAQDGKCAICTRPPKKGQRLHVDHCHESGAVRGLLCTFCNTRLGFLEQFGEVAAKYLVEFGQGNPLLKSRTQP